MENFIHKKDGDTTGMNDLLHMTEEEYRSHLIESGILTQSGRWKLLNAIPLHHATSLELKKLQIESAMDQWYKLPMYDVDNPQFDKSSYLKQVDELLRQIGDETPPIILIFEEISVSVPIYMKPAIETVWLGLRNLAKVPYEKLTQIFMQRRKNEDKTHFILEKVSGTVMPGEMLLVLGPPESGKSTLLRVLANQLDTNCHLKGEVRYGGTTYSSEIQHRVNFVDQDDFHMATLSVRDTLEFAAKCCIPNYVPFASRLRQDQLKIVTRALKLTHSLDTPLGNNKIRGVSGGEKKRVTIAEMFMGKRASINLLDNVTRGLDAAMSLEILKNFRSIANLQNETFICTMQQLSNEMYHLFDKVLVLDQGKCLFYGKTSDALTYFESIGLKKPEARSIPEFLCSVSEPAALQSIVKDGWENKVPTSPEAFYKCFSQSSYSYLKQTQAFASPSIEIATEGILESNSMLKKQLERVYRKSCLQSSTSQLRLLLHRQMKIEAKNKPALIARALRYILMSLIMGALFWSREPTEVGAEIYPGVLFIAIVTVGMGSLKTLPEILDSRAVFNKHRSNHFYDSLPFLLSQAVVEIPICFLESLIFSSILYFMVGLNTADGGRRFGFLVLCFFVLDITMASLTRFIAFISSSIHISSALANGFLVWFVVFAGFIIPRKHIAVWWIWLFWLSPFNYILDAVIINQFAGLELYCTNDELIPLNVPLESRICPLETGTKYISSLYGVFTSNLWKWMDVIIVLGFYFFFFILSLLALVYAKFSYRAYILPKKKENHIVQSTVEVPTVHAIDVKEGDFAFRNESLQQSERKDMCPIDRLATDVLPIEISPLNTTSALKEFFVHDISFPRIIFTWKNLSYYLPVSKKSSTVEDLNNVNHNNDENDTKYGRRLLDDIHGYALPGKLIALMGASGAGKTTLLDVLSDRKTQGTRKGEIRINGEPRNEFFRRIAGYIEQQDIHDDHVTVREALEFSARLRQPREVSDYEKLQSVEKVLDMLQLREIEHRLVGSSTSQNALMITAEARKRVTIGVELVSRSAILFLDEPTSGLDCRAAWLVMRAVRKVADTGRTVICTIHQPSTELFEMFDEMLLLQSGGQTCYFGPLGYRSQTMIQFFVEKGATPPREGQNPADWILELVNEDISDDKQEKSRKWSDIWKASLQYAETQKAIERYEKANETIALVTADGNIMPHSDIPSDNCEEIANSVAPVRFAHYMASSIKQQLIQVTKRAFVEYWRMPEYNLVRLYLGIAFGTIASSVCYHMPRNQLGAEIAIGVVFLSAIFSILNITTAIHPVEHQRDVFYKETTNGTYYPFVYWFGIFLHEIPFNLISVAIYVTCYYFLIGFPSNRFGYYLLSYILLSFTSITIGQCIAIFSPSQQVSQLIAPIVSSLMLLLTGFLIPKPAIPNYMIWLYWANPFSYALDSLSSAVWHQESFYCTLDEMYSFPLPFGETQCSSYSESYVTANQTICSSYLNATLTSDHCCLFCRFTNGNQLLSPYGLDFSVYWKDIGALFGFYLGFQLFALLGIQFVKYVRR
ncbi:hypothetical protein GpartN1_g2393.t1 [Galdieria partita]|uniref:Probable ATP-dependent transporter ycf16 n=1 Tax=Galdieria partita TaxID=83374 RepID=A0A9C7PVY1_9RHOD|nr:hypothetical protein GpartN1_g2393.t1 [Galdieria partita]